MAAIDAPPLSPSPTSLTFPTTRSSKLGGTPLTRRLQALLASSNVIDSSQGTLKALDALADVYGLGVGSTAVPGDGSIGIGGSRAGVPGSARRALGADVERAALESQTAFLEAFKSVVDQVAALDTLVATMSDDCTAMERDLDSAARKTAHLVARSSGLKQQTTSITVRRELSERFLARFTLSDAEVTLLTSPLQPSFLSNPLPTSSATTAPLSPSDGRTPHSQATGIGPAFFAALERAETLSNECEVLLEGESQVAGTDLLHHSTQLLRTGLSKLLRWATERARLLVEDEPDVPPTLQVAAKWLARDGHGGLENLLTTLATYRRPHVAQAFLNRLTLGPRPLELHTPDAASYVAAMMAWIHQRVAGEREVVETVVEEVKSQMAKDGKRAGEVDVWVEKAVGVSVEGTVGAIKVSTTLLLRIWFLKERYSYFERFFFETRIEQVLSSSPHPLTTYKVANVIQFYGGTVEKIVGRGGALWEALDELRETAYRVFFQSMEQQTTRAVRSMPPPDRSLQPPATLLSLLSDLRLLCATYDTSLVSTLHGESREDDFSPALSAALDPVFEAIESSGRSLGVWERGVYAVNCLGEVEVRIDMRIRVQVLMNKCLRAVILYSVSVPQAVLVQYPFTAGRAEAVESMIQGTIDGMAHEEYMNMLRESKLLPVVEAIEGNVGEKKIPLSSLPAATPSSLISTMLHLDSYLASHDPSARLARISSSRAARAVEKRASELFVKMYGRIYDQVRQKENGYEWPETVVGRRVGEVETLLGVDE
ncbi:Golgi transport complex subunit 6 [Gonapodya sp. JEL0774]|nr:Golgi transport complex subunit 6 [Gonapodya sp. JEL0774]